MFLVASVVYMLTAEPTTSLWDCGEFISAAHKLEVVHPPGAPLFLMIGRMFSFVAETFSIDKANIAYAINLMSGLSTATLVLFIFWSTTILARLSLVGYKGDLTQKGDILAVIGSGVVAALATTFASSVWFSAVEGEVYAMSSGFTGLVIWAALKWYVSTDAKADRWLVFIAYMIGLSIGVHLLSLLAIPFMAILFYYKRKNVADMTLSSNAIYGVLGLTVLIAVQFMNFLPLWAHIIFALGVPILYTFTYMSSNEVEKKIWVNFLIYFAIGFALLIFVQSIFIPKLPEIAAYFDFSFVNNFGLGLGTGMIFFLIILILGMVSGLYYSQMKKWYNLQLIFMMFTMALMGFSTYAMIVIRANANTPINMNNPSDPYSLLSYINREQYGERPLAYGPHFASENVGYISKGKSYRPVTRGTQTTYEVVSEKGDYRYKSDDMMLFPRLGHMDENRANQYRRWLNLAPDEKPTMSNNLDFFFRYQIGWMYTRYFMWNFVGRQNAIQGFNEQDPSKGNWLSGISFIDQMRLVPQTDLPESMKDQGRNTYYFLPLIFGLIGLLFQIQKRPQDALAVAVLFLVTGVAIIVFSNQPPGEPRERDYVLVGSIFTFCIWIGLSVTAIYHGLQTKVKNLPAAAFIASLLVLTAPILMGSQNWDDQSRAGHTAARDYANNFLQSCAPNAIVFTYGDNDTYPLWYAQEVEGIRPDVRVVNFSLLAVDWYIDQLRRKMNQSDAIPMSISKDAYRGSARNVLPIRDNNRAMSLLDVVKFMGADNPTGNSVSYVPATNIYIPVNKYEVKKNKAVSSNVQDTFIVQALNLKLEGTMLFKDDMALLDIIATNAANGWKRPIYFAVTVRPEKIGPFKNYLQLEGLAQRIVPIFTPGSESAGAMSMGRTEVDTMYRNIMEKFRWGGFDKKKMFVDESYSPSIQTQQYAFYRLIMTLQKLGDKKRALAVLEKMYEAFPHKNFPLDESYARVALSMFFDLGAEEKAKPLILDMAKASASKLKYFSNMIGGNSMSEFMTNLSSYTSVIENKRREINQIIQMSGGVEQMDQNMQNYAMKAKSEMDQAEAQKNTLLKNCAKPHLVSLFESDISNAIATAESALELVARMKDKSFAKDVEQLFAVYGLKSKSTSAAPAPQITSPVTDTAKPDSQAK